MGEMGLSMMEIWDVIFSMMEIWDVILYDFMDLPSSKLT